MVIAMRQVVFPRTQRGLILRLALLTLLALFVVYEITVRQVTPDAVQYSVVQTTNGETDFSLSGTITDPATVARWQAAMTAMPSGQYIWQVDGGSCAALSSYSATYTFLWRGMVVEVVSGHQSCLSRYAIYRGGIPDPHSYIIPDIVQPCHNAPNAGCYQGLVA